MWSSSMEPNPTKRKGYGRKERVQAWSEIPVDSSVPEPKEDLSDDLIGDIPKNVLEVFKGLEDMVDMSKSLYEEITLKPSGEGLSIDINSCTDEAPDYYSIATVHNHILATSGSWDSARRGLMKYPIWFSKNKFATDVPDASRMRHALFSLQAAAQLSVTNTILDVDNIFNYYMPSASDLSMLTSKKEVFFIDFTYGDPDMKKLSNLITSILSVDFGANMAAHCLVIRATKDLEPPIYSNIDAPIGVDWRNQPEEACVTLHECMKSYNLEGSKRIQAILEKSICAPLKEVLPSKSKNDNSIDALKVLVPDVLKALSSLYALEVEEVPDFLLSVIRGHGNPPEEVYLSLLPHLSPSSASHSFFSSGDDDVLCKSNLKGLAIMPPISSNLNPMLLMSGLEKVDYMLWVFVETRRRNDTWSPGEPLTYSFNWDGSINPLSEHEALTLAFDERQTLSRRFPRGVVAYSNFIVFEKVQESGTSIRQTASYFQCLMNPAYVSCENFTDFIGRADKTRKVSKGTSWVKPSSKGGESTTIVQGMLETLIPSSAELLRQTLSSRTLRFKNSLVMGEKSSASLMDASKLHLPREGSMLINLAESRSSCARAFVPFLNVKHPENCYAITEASDYAFVTLWSLPGSFGKFSTTWRREYSVSEHAPSSAYSLSTMRQLASGTPLDVKSHPLIVNIPQSTYSSCASINPDYTAASMRVDNLRFNSRGDVESHCFIVASKFSSIDRMNLEWEIELPYRLINRVVSLCEYRSALYSEKLLSKHQDLDDLKEINLNLLSFMPNRQQFSIISTAWRYLHQALGSIDCDPSSTLAKLSGVSVKSHIENNYLIRMISIYKLSMLARVMRNINYIRSNNREVFVVAPDLLFASNSAGLNVSTYSTSNLLNVTKSWRVASEAACVQAAWDQYDDLENLLMWGKANWYGMPVSTFQRFLGLKHKTFEALETFLAEEADDISVFTASLIKHSKPMPLTSNFWFEVLVHLRLRDEKGSFKMSQSLGGRGLREFLTMRGSSLVTRMTDYDSNPAVRKATAFLTLMARLKTNDGSITVPDKLGELDLDDETSNEDQLSLARSLIKTSYVRSVEPVCQFSEKDAPGKDREISTLNIEFGMLCLLCEKIVQPYSSAIPEDLVTHSAKEYSIYQSVLNLEKKREVDEDIDVLYVNQDKSKYGPNRKVSSMLISAAILSADDETFELFSLSLNMSSRKVISYPHELVKQSLGLEKPILKTLNEQLRLVRNPGRAAESLPQAIGATASIMRQIYEQFTFGNRYGAKGTTWVQVREGMPGQGIFTTLSSISHAAAQRFFSYWVGKSMNWEWSSRVTSDDSMTMILHDKKSTTMIHNGIKTLICALTYQMGLIENKAKMTITARRPEMNTFYMLKGEPICAVWKFSSAYTSIQTSGNIGEDLLSCVSKGSDLYRVGGSYYSASYLSATLITMTLDAYRFWGPYLTFDPTEDKITAVKELWDAPTEVFGIPSIDPIAPIITPVGTRVVSAMGETVSRDKVESYVKLLLDSILVASRLEQDNYSKDPYGNETYGGIKTMKLKEGEVKVPIRKLPPTVNGLIGSLFRRKNEIKVAKELGAIASRYPKVTSHKGWKIKRLLEAVRASFDVPMKRGHAERGILQIYQEIAHSPDYKFLKVSPNSFFPKDYLGTSLSMNDLKMFLSNSKNVKAMKDNFLGQLDNERPMQLDLEKLESSLLESSRTCIRLSDIVKSSKLVPNLVKGDYQESVADRALGRTVFKRLIRVTFNDQLSVPINFHPIKVSLLNHYIKEKPRFMNEYRGLKIEPGGNLDEFEAWEESEITLERIKGLMPKASILYSESLASGYSRENEINDWIKYNALIDHNFNVSAPLLKQATGNADSTYTLPNDHGSKSYIMHSYAYGPFGEPKTYRYEADTILKRYSILKDSGTIPASWIFQVDEASLHDLATTGQVCRTSYSVLNDIQSNVVNLLWYGSPNMRTLIRRTRRLMSDEGTFFIVEASITESNPRRYLHKLIIYSDLGINYCKNGSELDDYVSNWCLNKGGTSNRSNCNFSTGEDHYSVVFLGPLDTFQVQVNFLDYFVVWDKFDIYLPLGRNVNLAHWGLEDIKLLEHLSSSNPLLNYGPAYRDLPKIPLFKISEDDQQKWAIKLDSLMVGLSSESFSVPLRKLLTELAASFLISGKVYGLNTRDKGGSLDLDTFQSQHLLYVRSRHFSRFCSLVKHPRFALVEKFYDSWAAHSSGFSPQAAIVPFYVSRDLMTVEEATYRFVPEEWKEIDSSLVVEKGAVTGLLKGFESLVDKIRNSIQHNPEPGGSSTEIEAGEDKLKTVSNELEKDQSIENFDIHSSLEDLIRFAEENDNGVRKVEFN